MPIGTVRRTGTGKRRHPVQVYLDEREWGWLEQAAAASGLSKSDVLRRGVRLAAIDLIPPEQDPAWRLIGLAGEDNEIPTDFAERHDEYLVKWERESYFPPEAYERRDDDGR